MSLTRQAIDQLAARIGAENVLSSEADRIVYSTDVGSPPAIVDLLVNRKADCVARCHTLDDVETVVAFCRRNRIPITPRAAATNALGGSVPKRAGVVLDLTCMDRHVDIDEEAMTVTVDAGVRIWALQERLLAVGLELPCYPTSALGATIGGFVAMDGHGIHATRAGNIGRHVLELEGVGGDGKRFHIRDADEIAFFTGLGGSTGIITRITLKLQEATKDRPFLVSVRNTRQLQALMDEARRLPCKHIMFHNADFFKLRTEAKGERKNPLPNRIGVLLVLSEGDAPKHEEAIGRMAERVGGRLEDDKLAASEWDERFYPIRAKRLGPSLVAGEVYVPTDKIHGYLSRLRAKAEATDLCVEGHVTDDGRVYFFIFTLDDERRASYPLGWGTSAWILSLAKKFGGRSYHSGVWLQWESKSVFGKARYKKLKSYKKLGDHYNLFNPGMVFPLPAPVPEFVYKLAVKGPVPAPSLGFQLWAGNPMLQYPGLSAMNMHRIYRRRKTLGVKAADAAADMARGGKLGMHTDLIWGCDIPSLEAMSPPGLPMTQTPRGKMVLTKQFVRGKIADPWELKAAFDVADPDAEDAAVAPEYEEIKVILDQMRATLQAEGVELEVKIVEAPEEEEVVEVAAEAGESKLDIEAIKKQAAETPEEEKAWVVAADCIVCNGCESACPTDAAIVTDIARVDRDLCIADGGCFDACPTDAIRPGIEEQDKSAGWPEGSRLAGKFGT